MLRRSRAAGPETGKLGARGFGRGRASLRANLDRARLARKREAAPGVVTSAAGSAGVLTSVVPSVGVVVSGVTSAGMMTLGVTSAGEEFVGVAFDGGEGYAGRARRPPLCFAGVGKRLAGVVWGAASSSLSARRNALFLFSVIMILDG